MPAGAVALTSSTLIDEAEEEADLFALTGSEEPDENKEEVQVRLDLSQLDALHSKRPRVHWARSPLGDKASQKPLAEGEEEFMKRVIKRRSKEGVDKSNALCGLLRAKSKESSPLSEAASAGQGSRAFESPLNPATGNHYITTTAPSSEPDGVMMGTPLRPKSASPPPPPAVLDIEDLGGAIGSSFFSDTDIVQNSGEVVALAGDEFDDLDFDGEIEGFLLPSGHQPPAITGPLHNRFIIYTVETGAAGPHTARLTGININCQAMQSFLVRGDWLRCLTQQPPITLHAVFEAEGVIDDVSGYLVVCPDRLVSSTLVADSVSCQRRAILSSRYQASVEDSKPSASLICGSIVHEVVEQALISQVYNMNHLHGHLAVHVKRALGDIYVAGCEEAAILGQSQELLRPFPDWAQRHLVGPPVDTQESFIPKVLRTEEGIWSHTFGLKGKIDATVLLHDNTCNRLLLAPLELKTGRGTTSVSHRAQTLLYGFMLWDRYGLPIDQALLLYLATGELFKLQPSRTDLRALLMARNMLALSMERAETNAGALPPPISNKHVCSRCFQLESCTLAYRLLEGKADPERAPSTEHLALRTGHLAPSAIDRLQPFIARWSRLVALEEAEAIAARQSLWTQATSSSVTDLYLVECMALPEGEATPSAAWLCRFQRHSASQDTFAVTMPLAQGDPVVVSAADEPVHGLAIGHVKSTTGDGLLLALDRPPHDISPSLGAALGCPVRTPIMRFRVDKDELMAGYGLLRTNLLKLGTPESQHLMELVVMETSPTFLASIPAVKFPDALLVAYQALDSCQQAAIQRILVTQDYLLVLGMPGTGKSTTLALAIRILLHLGRTILLSSHTHSAIDSILLKLQASDPELRVARLGNPSRIAKALHAWSLESQQFNSLDQLAAFYENARLVACTCLGSNHQLLHNRRFDICILDEASQVSIPAGLGPLRLSSSFLLVGDHYQLPPLVRSRQAQEEGLNQSLFALLANAHPSAIAMLRQQYRMNAEIMAISNALVYGGLLVCGNEQVGSGRLEPKKQLACCKGCTSCWFRMALDPQCPVLFLDTDSCEEAKETAVATSYSNAFEISLIHTVVQGLVQAGIEASEISVISPYRPQLRLFAEDPRSPPDLRHSTVDRFQGLDSDCILISLVRSNAEGNIGQLLRDWNRLNVAFTRARKKLVLVGSQRTVLQQDLFKGLYTLFKERRWIHRIPIDALNHHV